MSEPVPPVHGDERSARRGDAPVRGRASGGPRTGGDQTGRQSGAGAVDDSHDSRRGLTADGPSTPRRGARAAADDARTRATSAGSARVEGPARRGRQADADVRGETEKRSSGKDAATRRTRRSATDGAGGARPGNAPADASSEVRRVRGQWPMAERSLIGGVLGVPPWVAVGVAAAITAIGVAVDLLRIGTIGSVFLVCYLSGCVLGTAWVRRRGLFWPMVAPPLLMAVAVPVVVLLAAEPRPGAGITQRLLVIGAPLVNGFPMMAWTTGLVLALGVFRLVTQRIGRDAARAGGRTSASPRRS